MFEEAARQHKRFEKVQETLKLRDEMARDVGRLNGVAITRSVAANAVELWFVRDGGLVGGPALRFRGPRRQARFVRPEAARNHRGGGGARHHVRASGASIWPCWRAGFTPPGGMANGWPSKATTKSPTASW